MWKLYLVSWVLFAPAPADLPGGNLHYQGNYETRDACVRAGQQKLAPHLAAWNDHPHILATGIQNEAAIRSFICAKDIPDPQALFQSGDPKGIKHARCVWGSCSADGLDDIKLEADDRSWRAWWAARSEERMLASDEQYWIERNN
jgi:hypothetical protein